MKTYTERHINNAYDNGWKDRGLLETSKKVIANKGSYSKHTIQKSQKIVDNYLKLKKDGAN
jgi:hypothetical protein